MKLLKAITLPVFGSLAVGLVACSGDESFTENTYNSTMESVETNSDMMKCDSSIAGQTIFVKDEGIFYGCDGKQWKEFGGNTVSVGSMSVLPRNWRTSPALKSTVTTN